MNINTWNCKTPKKHIKSIKLWLWNNNITACGCVCLDEKITKSCSCVLYKNYVCIFVYVRFVFWVNHKQINFPHRRIIAHNIRLNGKEHKEHRAYGHGGIWLLVDYMRIDCVYCGTFILYLRCADGHIWTHTLNAHPNRW